jgi:hypothetical protein
MADAIDNLAQDLNQANAVDEFPGYPGYKMGDLVPDMAGVRVGDLFYGLDPYGQEAPYNWRTGGFEYQAAPQDLSNPSTLATGGEMDYNVRDQPVERINEGSTDEKDAFVRTGIGTTLDPKTEDRGVSTGIGTALDPMTEDRYRFTGLIPPDKAGTFIGVQYLDPSEAAVTTAGQIPSVNQGVVTRGEPVSIPGRTIPDYIPIGQMENGDVLYADRNNIRDTIIRPSAYSVSQEDLDKGVVPQKFDFGTNTAPSTSQVTPTSVGAYQPVGANERTTDSEGGFDNTGGNVTAGPGGVKDITPGWKEEAKPKPKVENDIDGDGISDVWRIATGGNWRFDTEGNWSNVNPDYIDPKTGREEPPNNTGDRWNFRTEEWDYKDVPGTTPPGGGTTTTPPGGGAKPPTGGGQPPGGGTPGGGPPGGGTPGRGPTPLPPREPVTPLIRRETVIPTKGTKEVPLPDRQADPFAKLYADLLANSQQQEDRYRYINYDPDQIMNAAMSGFRRRGAMRSLQG